MDEEKKDILDFFFDGDNHSWGTRIYEHQQNSGNRKLYVRYK